MMRLRIATGLAIAALYVVIAAPIIIIGRYRGRRSPVSATVGLHRWLCVVLGVKVQRLGAPGAGARLIVANHVSWLDILVLGAMEPAAFLAKKEIGANRWTRWLVDLQGAVYVDRSRRRCLPAVNTEIAQLLIAGVPIVLFAEGTTNDGVRLLPLRSSHFEAVRQASVNVQPVYLDYRAIGGLRATRQDLPTIAWYGDMMFVPSLCKILASGGVSCDVKYGETIAYDDTLDRKSLARRAEAAMRRLKADARER
jgi:lyso-ornithine lipid O-acyltransferase